MQAHALALLANLLWGLMPLYYAGLGSWPPASVLAFQVVFTSLALLLARRGRFGSIERLRAALPSALLLAINWGSYLAAVIQGRVLEASYGYLIMPVMTMLLGRWILGQRLAGLQWLGLGVCLLAVLVDLATAGVIPVYGFAIGLSFALYTCWHSKRGTQDSVSAVRDEVVLMAPFAMAYLLLNGELARLVGQPLPQILWLAAIGLVTSLPLMLFVGVAHRLSAFQLGAYQFVAPLVSGVLGVAVFATTLTGVKAFSMLCLVVGLLIALLGRDEVAKWER